ncbi:hypothetical protein TEA_021737 [Camellia sinensis var. sinensis]|uniref:V-type proton ATPase subunit F n=1 Tax=Camellia sinensis var. sinensis TaxID=542762 RepID=A0A4S4E115_CAMSN|nr:hypothetical protein TEA_021737 [Camellia sinensis var. sinensis]
MAVARLPLFASFTLIRLRGSQRVSQAYGNPQIITLEMWEMTPICRAFLALEGFASAGLTSASCASVGLTSAGCASVSLPSAGCTSRLFYYGFETTVKQIEDAFKEFTTREDIAIVMISQFVANMIRFLVDSYNKPVPAILEIPSKDHPYDPTHDSVLSRVKYLFSAESVASGRR